MLGVQDRISVPDVILQRPTALWAIESDRRQRGKRAKIFTSRATVPFLLHTCTCFGGLNTSCRMFLLIELHCRGRSDTMSKYTYCIALAVRRVLFVYR
jgi:hypothetical protein